MLRMLEVIGTSEAGFSEAVKEAVERIIASGERIHFFEVVEQRGAVGKEGLREFQVKLKIAIEEKSTGSVRPEEQQ